MTAEADQIRDKRRHTAAPGGSHDRLVRFLARALPVAIGVLAAVLILTPLAQRGEISFLLDRKKVEQTSERLSVDKATYRGTDDKGRNFVLTAQRAAQGSATVPVVRMDGLSAQLDLTDGPASLTAPGGDYDFKSEQVAIRGPVLFSAADGYRMMMEGVAVNLHTRTATGSGGVRGAVPTGTFSANSVTADLGERTIVLEGNARLQMVPGKLRIPK